MTLCLSFHSHIDEWKFAIMKIVWLSARIFWFICLSQGPPSNPGINQRALQLLFREVEQRSSDWEYTIKVAVMEIYNENLR